MICRSCLRTRAQAQASLLPFVSSRARVAPIRSFSSTPPHSHPRILGSERLPTPILSRRQLSSSAEAPSSRASTIPDGPEKPDYLSEGESQVWDILMAELSPTELTVKDISGGCGSMYGIDIVSEKFRGLTMLKQQRLVNATLGDLVKEWHGLQLKTKTP
ncbi:BolA protein [Naviculisporaceae sp. PSN 640]